MPKRLSRTEDALGLQFQGVQSVVSWARLSDWVSKLQQQGVRGQGCCMEAQRKQGLVWIIPVVQKHCHWLDPGKGPSGLSGYSYDMPSDALLLFKDLSIPRPGLSTSPWIHSPKYTTQSFCKRPACTMLKMSSVSHGYVLHLPGAFLGRDTVASVFYTRQHKSGV